MPVKLFIFLFSLLWFSTTNGVEVEEALIVNSMESGRLGVQVYRFAKAFSLSKKHGIPFRYVDPNKRRYFAQLSVDSYLEEFSPEDGDRFEKVIHLKSEEELASLSTSDCPTLYICYNHTRFNYKKYLAEEPDYKKELQDMLRPKVALSPVMMADMFSVAVHYRTGRGFDGPFLQDQSEKEPGVAYVDEKYPLRFLPVDFYFEQLEWVFQRLNGQPLFVRIFTDDPNIPEVEEAFQRRFADYPILIAENTVLDYENSTITDWWTMSFFDCLIRPDSHYSKISELIGDHKIIIFPRECHFEGTKLIIDKVKRRVRGIKFPS